MTILAAHASRLCSILALSAIVCGVAGSTPTEAAGPIAGPVARNNSRKRLVKLPDLTCTLQVFKDSAANKPLTSGQVLGYGSGRHSVWVRRIVENKGGQPARDFEFRFAVRNGTTDLIYKKDMLTLPPGLAKIYPLVEVKLTSTNRLYMNASVDPDNVVKESHEGRYSQRCHFRIDATVVA
ncbi:MAG: hypothetical protein JKY37_00100 [Nannocystaceae bacterium]|nr:hypothetical protein [Nannocystaceae bacterium]